VTHEERGGGEARGKYEYGGLSKEAQKNASKYQLLSLPRFFWDMQHRGERKGIVGEK